MTGQPQTYHTTMSWQQLIAAVSSDMAALYASSGAGGTVTSVGLSAGSSDITLGTPNPVTSSGSIPIDVSSAVKTALTAAGTALQPVTGLSGTYTYASLTLNASGQITAAASESPPTSAANPTASVGLGAVNGSASTYMRSDAAPALNQGIAPTWTGAHIFNASTTLKATFGASASFNAASMVGFGSSSAVYQELLCTGTANAGILLGVNGLSNQASVQYVYNPSASYLQIGTSATTAYISFLVQSAECLRLLASGTAKFVGSIGVNGATPPAQVTGWGTPTGAAVVSNFNGASATLVNCSNAIAEIISILKSYGLIGA